MGKTYQSMKIAFRALRVNKLRSALTMLGIIIGVGAVITMVSVGNGASADIQARIASIGSNVIIVRPQSQWSGGVRSARGEGQSLTEGDATAIGTELTAVNYASPMNEGNAQVVFGNNNANTRIYGVTADYLNIRDIKVETGNIWAPDQVQGADKVALLGKTVVDSLFLPGFDPVGETIRVNNVPIRVIGTLVPKGQSGTGEDQDDMIIMPITTAKKKVIGSRRSNSADGVSQIIVQGAPNQAERAMRQITDLLRQRHKIGITDEDDFEVRSLEEIAQAAQASSQVMGLLLAAIASVSLIVGGIGIMNIMLVSVTERTKEIGLRQAVGAKTADILSQFLVEAISLSVLGGFIGILCGLGASRLISSVAGWSTAVSPGSIVAAFVFSALVGVFFGYYPARKAAYLDPIEALRYE